MEMQDLRAMTADDLRSQLAKSGERIFRVRFEKSMGVLEGLKSLRQERLTIARVKTLLRERSAGQEGEAKTA